MDNILAQLDPELDEDMETLWQHSMWVAMWNSRGSLFTLAGVVQSHEAAPSAATDGEPLLEQLTQFPGFFIYHRPREG